MSNKKFGLFLGGGSVHTSFGAGYVSGIEHHGILKDIEKIVGQSAGAFMACYLLAGNARRRTVGYWSMDHKVHFSLIHNVKKYKTPFFYKYLLKDMFLKDNPVEDWDVIISHPLNQQGKFLIQVYDVIKGETLFLQNFKNSEAILEAIIGSCWLPILGGIKPYQFSKNALSNMQVTNAQGESLDCTHLKVFDSYISDRYLTEVMQSYKGKKFLILNQHAENRVYGVFGKYGKFFEFFATYILFTPYFNGIKAYNKNITFGGANRVKKRLLKASSQEHTNLTISLPKVHISGWESEVFRQKALMGYESFCKQWNIKNPSIPQEWEQAYK